MINSCILKLFSHLLSKLSGGSSHLPHDQAWRGCTGQQGQHVVTLLVATPGNTYMSGLNTEEFGILLLIFRLLDPYSNALQ